MKRKKGVRVGLTYEVTLEQRLEEGGRESQESIPGKEQRAAEVLRRGVPGLLRTAKSAGCMQRDNREDVVNILRNF